MSEDQKKQLEDQLWGIANVLRGKISADDYRDYILGFIFYKYLSEKQVLYAQELLATENITDYHEVTDIELLHAIEENSIERLGYYLPPDQLFSELAARGQGRRSGGTHILDDLQAVLNHIEQTTMGTDSEEDFDKLFEDIDLGSTKLGRTVKARNEVVVQILARLDAIDFKLEEADSDVLGDAYEYLISKFAAGAGKKAGEFYTPQQVSTILARLVTTGKDRIQSAYDPTCGSGSLLLRIGKEVQVERYYGQEQTRTTYNLARMNMILHDVHYSRFDIRQDDTLENPQHPGLRFEAIVANPPFSAKWTGSDNPLYETDERFARFGRLAPKSMADYAFLQHMYHHLSENGAMASVVPHGVLFRSGAEAVIREHFIAQLNALDAVIGLPANLFYGTTIPTCIVVMKACREQGDDVVFIDASGDDHFEKQGNQNVLRPSDIDRIVTTYRERTAIEKYSAVVSLAEIAENDYNLNIPRYVDTFEDEEPVDLDAVAAELRAVDQELADNQREIAAFCTELGIQPPF